MDMNGFLNELGNHGKVFEIESGGDDATVTCEVDCIQSVSRAIVKRIGDKYGTFTYKSSGRNVKNLGYTKVKVYAE